MIESYATALQASGILEQAATVLENRLAAAPGDPQTLGTLGAIYRKQGRLPEAAATYDRLNALAPDNGYATFIRAVLKGEVPPRLPADDALQPAPFALFHDFLPAAVHDGLRERVLAAPDEDIEVSLVGANDYNPDVRQSYTVGGLDDVRLAFWHQVERVLPSVFARLQVAPFTVHKREVQVRTYRAGNFFDAHRDDSMPRTANRRVSYVYFFHRVPRRYAGGELLVFDTSADSKRYSITNFTKVVPVDNMLIMFPSRFWHAVVPVQCDSPDPGDTRFVINGHIQCA